MMQTTLDHSDGLVTIDELPDNTRRLSVRLADPTRSVQRAQCVTSYPINLIRSILNIKGPGALCDEIMRDEDPTYVRPALERSIFAYIGSDEMRNCRLLDFGCGSGASTVLMSRLLPETRIVGIELDPALLGLARQRIHALGIKNVELHESPDPMSLPIGIGSFDFVILNAVVEHLYPEERVALLPALWDALEPKGILFINETPNRWFFREIHTTGLPLINYLPRPLAHWAVRRFCRRFSPALTWRELLREGLRGGSEGEVLAILRRAGNRPELLNPCRLDLHDRVDLRFSLYNEGKFLSPKQRLRKSVLKLVYRLTGITISPSLILALRK